MAISTFAAAQVLRFVPRVRLSRAVGKLCEQPLPPKLSRVACDIYAKAFRVDLSDAEAQEGPYETFDAFFTRKLKDGAREIADASIVSPADGKVVAAGDISAGTQIRVKGREYDVAELTGVSGDRQAYAQGEYAVVYLHPRDYHRVHSPVDGRLTCVRGLPGDLFPVNAIGEQHIPRLFVRNQRLALTFETEDLGAVTVVMVGATIVGKMTVRALSSDDTPIGEFPMNPSIEVQRGDEIGTFHLGSTVVVLFERSGRVSRATGPVFYGESLMRIDAT